MNAIFQKGFLVAAIVLALTVPANAGPYEDGLAAGKRGDYTTALRLWQPLAEQGDARAQAMLGFLYANGAEAAKWYRMAAEQGSAEAQLKLGIFYGMGRAVPQDYAAAYMWFTLAAAQGEEKARTARDSLVKRMTHGQIEEATLLVREWRREHQQ